MSLLALPLCLILVLSGCASTGPAARDDARVAAPVATARPVAPARVPAGAAGVIDVSGVRLDLTIPPELVPPSPDPWYSTVGKIALGVIAASIAGSLGYKVCGEIRERPCFGAVPAERSHEHVADH